MVHVHHRVTTVDVGKKVSPGESWESFKVLFHGFADLPSEVDQFTLSPTFKCNGHDWCLCIYPGGVEPSMEGYLALYLKNCSEGTALASFEISVLDKFQGVRMKFISTSRHIMSCGETMGWQDYCPRSTVLSKYLDDEGTLAIVVSMERDTTSPFVPSNPMSGMITAMFLDEDSADVCFEVSGADVPFHAHSFILKACAPMLASLFGSDDDDVATVLITDVKPAIFRHMLHYVYGGSVSDGEMKTYSKDIINAADKYSIANLKLEAEAAYVKSTGITMDNAIENLLFADALHLALLKEAVMDFLAENHDEAIKKVSFADVPGHLMKDLLVAFGRKNRVGANTGSDDDLSTMRVSELRWRLSELGLDVDGSREAMIEALGATSHGT